MTQNYKKNIFLYNKKNELITYVDLDNNGHISNCYILKDRVLTKLNAHEFKEKNKLYTDIKKAKIVFGEDCKLFHMFLEGDSYCKVIKKDSLRIEPPVVLSTIYSHNEEFLEGYTINQSLIQDWLKKL